MDRLNGISLVIVAAGACTAPVQVDSASQAAGSCPPLICGYNSPEIDHYGFHELEVTGVPNDQGFSIVELHKEGTLYRLEVLDGRIVGTDPRLGTTLEGKDLVGAELVIDHNGAAQYVIRVTEVGSMPFPVGAPDPVETYVLEYTAAANGVPIGDKWANVCTDLPDSGNPDDSEYLGQHARDSIVFEGDRIDLETKTLNDKPDPSWFNIGCAGHTLAKLHLTRNTISSQGPSYRLYHAERQATLKMLTADYCGDGTAFTVAGQRLVWQGDLVTYLTMPSTIEARWTEKGAACLDVPRMAIPTNEAGAKQFPDIEAAIAAQCRRPPPCRDPDPLSFDGALRVSGNP